MTLPPIHEVRAELCKRSLFFFVKEMWDIIVTDPYEHNWHIEFMCDVVQVVYDKFVFERETYIPKDKWYPGFVDSIKRKVVFNISPGTTKSTIVTRKSPAWAWGVDDTITVITNTIDHKNASNFSVKSRDLIQSEKFHAYFPKVKIRKDVGAKLYYASENGGERYSLTTRGSKTGKHASILIEDDPEDYDVANNPTEHLQVIESFKALQTRKKDKRKTPYILVMQRLSSNDLSSFVLKKYGKDVTHICLPAEDLHNNIYPPELRQYYVDGLLDPLRLSREVLENERKGLSDDAKPISDIAYNIQYNQVSQSVEGLMYEPLNFVESLPANRYGAIRLSFTDVADEGDDYFCTWFAEINKDEVYVFDAIFNQESSKNTNEQIKTKIRLHGSHINNMETNNQGSVYVTWLQSQGVPINGYYSTGKKITRIKSYSQFIGALKFINPDNNPNQEYRAAVKHLQSFPKQGKAEDKHDDAEDAMTALLMYLHTNHKYLFMKMPE